MTGGAAMVIGVVGAGVMGMGIAQIAAQSGVTVRVFDTRADGAAQGRSKLAQTLGQLQTRGKLTAEQVQSALDAIVPAATLAELHDCEIVIEAIVEDLGAKQALFAQLEQVVGERCILATNTSSLSVTSIAAGLKRPHRVGGFHFFNPVPVMKIVEVVDGLLTDADVGETLLALGRRMGHTAVRAKDTPGFIVNHAGRGFGTEALRILSEGIAEFHDVDRVMREVAGFVIGPFELMDITALDVSHPVMESIYRQFYEEPRFRPQPLTRQMLAAGIVGRKVGRGFYRYADGKREAIAESPAPAARPVRVWVAPDAGQPLGELLARLGAEIDTGARPGAESLCVVAPIGDDATSCAERLGLDARRTVAVETLFDTGRRRVVMTTPATSAEWREAAHAVFASDGVPVTMIRDSAGMIAQRVVATIVNIACDIAQQRIATPADIDRAVVLGLAYPLGPLAWGDKLGAGTVLKVLERLQTIYGDPRYRPSPWLKRRAQLGMSLLADEA